MSNQEGAGPLKFAAVPFPLLGLILYMMWKDERPIAAKEMGKWAIFGVIFNVVIVFLSTLLMFLPFLFI